MARRTLMLFLAGLLATTFSAAVIAQEKEGGKAGAEPAKPAGEKAKPKDAIHKALADLSLTEEQKTQVDSIIADGEARIKEAKSAKDKKAVRTGMYDQIIGVLNDEQKPKFERKIGYKPAVKKEERKKEGGAPK